MMEHKIVEDDDQKILRKGWAEMIKKVYEVDPLILKEFSRTSRRREHE